MEDELPGPTEDIEEPHLPHSQHAAAPRGRDAPSVRLNYAGGGWNCPCQYLSYALWTAEHPWTVKVLERNPPNLPRTGEALNGPWLVGEEGDLAAFPFIGWPTNQRLGKDSPRDHGSIHRSKTGLLVPCPHPQAAQLGTTGGCGGC